MGSRCRGRRVVAGDHMVGKQAQSLGVAAAAKY